MKKIITGAFLALFSMASIAATQVPVYWPFSISSVQVTAIRAVLDSANTESDKRYVVAHKPGAGSAIAARHVATKNGREMLAVSSSYFMRPLFYPESSHAVSDLQPVVRFATRQPALIMSKQYNTLDELRKQDELTIGMINGSVTNLIALTLAKQLPDTKLTLVPYKGTNAPTLDVLGGSLDLNVGFVDDVHKHVKAGNATIIGLTGKERHRDIPTLVEQGATDFADVTMEYWLMTDASVSEAEVREMHALFTRHLDAGTAYWGQDEAVVEALSYEDTVARFNQQAKYWADLKDKVLN